MQTVTLHVKAVIIGEPEEVRPKDTWRVLQKQECIVGDASGTIRLVMWQEGIGTLKPEHSYKLIDVTVRTYAEKKYISLSVRSRIEEIQDIGEIAEIDSDCKLKCANLVVGRIVGVMNCEQYTACPNCAARLTRDADADKYDIIQCSKCGCKTMPVTVQ